MVSHFIVYDISLELAISAWIMAMAISASHSHLN